MRQSALVGSVQQDVDGQPEESAAAAVRLHSGGVEPGRRGRDPERHDRLAARAAQKEISHTSSDVHVRGRFRRRRVIIILIIYYMCNTYIMRFVSDGWKNESTFNIYIYNTRL